ncbi:MAG: ATP-binding protein [Parabacteroides sp.]|nr:ATP-binding protein [Parabacteroides sp.]MDY4756141.1 ATP-binding protein [Parabacteroides sp.]
MIAEIRIKNYLSFRDEVVLNFEATKDTTFEESQVVQVTPKVRLLRFALIFGANASGKSNLLSALEFLRSFWFAKKEDLDEETGAIPFLLDTETPAEPSEFNIKFYIGDKRYWYILQLNERQVIKEALYIYNSVQPSSLFLRKMEGTQSVVKLNGSLVKASATIVEQLNLKCLPNMSFFAARNQVNCALRHIDEVRDWMRNNMMQIIDPNVKMFAYAGKKLEKDAELKKYLLDFIHKADYNITDVYSERESVPIPDFIRTSILEDDTLPPKLKERMLAENSIERLNTDFQHTVHNKRGVEQYRLSNELQSAGTRRTFGLEAAIYEAIQSEGILPIDELESSLHPELVEFIIEHFLRKPGRSQLIVTTHYDPLLNTVDDLFRKDSVWFTEKGDDGHTRLYSLTDFKGLSKVSSFQKSYRNGVFGALPNIHH